MYQKFDGQKGAIAYLLFVLLYFPCVSTVAVMLRELHRGWSIFSMLWMTCIAYGTAVGFYQAATWMQHPLASSAWIFGILGIFTGAFIFVRVYVDRMGNELKPQEESRMGLLDIKQHMMQVRIASLSSLCLLFKTDAETLRCMLSHWIRKGSIRQCVNKSACGTKCFKCPGASVELYEWVEAGMA